MAVTRTGIPIRVWCWPGNASDQELIRQVKDDLRAWKLARVVWVADRGFQSAENRRYLQRAGGHYILGEKLRGNDKEANAALARQGRYHTVAGNLRVKEVVIDDGTMRDRFVICHNPEEAKRDEHGPRAAARPDPGGDRRHRRASRPPSATSSTDSCQPSAATSASCARPRPASCGSTAPRSTPRRTSTASSCSEPQTRP